MADDERLLRVYWQARYNRVGFEMANGHDNARLFLPETPELDVLTGTQIEYDIIAKTRKGNDRV
jgi:hypothetical protein